MMHRALGRGCCRGSRARCDSGYIKEYFLDQVRDTIPRGREQTPEDIGKLTAFLCSDKAKNITGLAINVNGGSFFS